MALQLVKSVTPLSVQVDIIGNIECYRDDVYTVSKTHKRLKDNVISDSIIHLVVQRLDDQPVSSWTDMQRIKNELVGDEYTGVEVFPPESMLTDAANCYHIWVFPTVNFRLPFTLHSHRVVTNK